MPTYDYKCTQCNHRFELFQPMSAEPLKICPECKGNLKRLIGTGAGPIFKGSGFYQTDYKNKQGGKSSTNTATTKKEEKPVEKKSEKPSGDSTKK